MSVGFDPFVSSFLFTAGLIPHAARPHADLELPARPATIESPSVTVIVALYREKWDDIEMTIDSLIRQTYGRDRFDVLLVVEARDLEIRPHAEAGRRKLEAAGITCAIITSDGGKRLKAYALNRAIAEARGDICAFYDASDDIDPQQLERAALLMHEQQYDAVQATVLRKGRSILSEFLFIDTAFWFRKYIPFVLKLAGGMPLSGEGLFVRTTVLREVGGFPEVLTEDAYLGIMLTERGKRFGLVSSVITEKAPKNMKAHFVQRLRWNRGYLTCLWRLLRSSLSLKRKAALSLPFITPISCALAFVGWLVLAATWRLPNPFAAGTIVFLIGVPLCVMSYLHMLWTLRLRRSIPFVLLLPYYWTFVGVAATCSFFKNTTTWGKTER